MGETNKERLWWHYYGGEMPVGAAMFGVLVLGSEALMGPPMWAEAVVNMDVDVDGIRHSGQPVQSPIFVLGPEHPEYVLNYIRTWDHAPSQDEIEAVTPESWRLENGVPDGQA